MNIRFCGMCGESTRSLSEVFLPAERRTIETRWCPQCGALGIRERKADKTTYETWEQARAQREELEEDTACLLDLIDPQG